MLLGIFSDTHLGFGSDDRFEEAFARFKEALSIFKSRNADFILHAGDLFDEAVPEQEVWKKAFECFAENNGALTEIKKHQISGTTIAHVKGKPIIAIHGTHEFRGKDFTNAIAILEEANCLVHLHAGHVVLEKNGEKVFIHGLGGVPEKHAKEVLEKYSPKPIAGGTNLLMLHQSFKEFLPFDEDESIASLSLADLPNDFDLIIDGHLHWSNEQKLEGKRFLLTGSTIFTQMKKLEGQHEKGVFIFDTNTKTLDFIPFSSPRKLFYEKMEFKNAKPEEVIAMVNSKFKEIENLSFDKKPLVRFKLCGTLAKGFTQSDVSFSVPTCAIFSISKEFSVENFEKKIQQLKAIQMEKKSVIDFGIDILEKNVEEAKLVNFQTRRLFDLLSIGEMEKAESVLLNAEK
ncbi:MAG: metallophosphoesterase [archaeon]|jgi:DNA repair exonuclease SbcCD nuclease subunit